jgi:hypothetical protein
MKPLACKACGAPLTQKRRGRHREYCAPCYWPAFHVRRKARRDIERSIYGKSLDWLRELQGEG